MNGAQLLAEYEHDPDSPVVKIVLDRLADEAEHRGFNREAVRLLLEADLELQACQRTRAHATR